MTAPELISEITATVNSLMNNTKSEREEYYAALSEKTTATAYAEQQAKILAEEFYHKLNELYDSNPYYNAPEVIEGEDAYFDTNSFVYNETKIQRENCDRAYAKFATTDQQIRLMEELKRILLQPHSDEGFIKMPCDTWAPVEKIYIKEDKLFFKEGYRSGIAITGGPVEVIRCWKNSLPWKIKTPKIKVEGPIKEDEIIRVKTLSDEEKEQFLLRVKATDIRSWGPQLAKVNKL